LAGIVGLFLTVLCPTPCSIGVGIIACGTRVFTPQSGFSQLGVNAVIVGVLVWMARRWPARRFLEAGGPIVLALTGIGLAIGFKVQDWLIHQPWCGPHDKDGV
jgi:hypothetical protein